VSAVDSDGHSIVINSTRNGVFDLYSKAIDGSGHEDLVLATPFPKGPTDWSPDGRFLLFRSPEPKTGFDIWAVLLEGDRKPFPVVRTNFDEFSSDGKWIADQSNQSGQYEIYLQPFPDQLGESEFPGTEAPRFVGGEIGRSSFTSV
jgi:eukaryotic-like serine/threonine-protein kinase